MNGSLKRRRRTGSTSARYQPSQLVPVESIRPGNIGKVELAACGAVAIVAFALIALIWMVTMRAVQDQQAETRYRAEQVLSGQAATIAETIGHELLMIDQSLTVLQAAWQTDSDTFDLLNWQTVMPALTAVADDVFIADEHRVIKQDILPKAIGQGIGAAYVTFPHGSLEQFQSDGTRNKDSLGLEVDASQPINARHFLMYVIKPLDRPTGWLIGASFRSEELTKLYAKAALGYNSVVFLIDTKRGIVQSVVGQAARRPRTDISKSPLFIAMTRSPKGVWLGENPADGVERMHASYPIENRDMSVVLAADWSDVMAISDNLAAGARAVAFAGSALVLMIGGLVLWEFYTIRANKRQKRVGERNRRELERLRTEETVLVTRAHLNAARLRIVVDSTADGIALFDANLRLVQWNHPFQRGIGVDLVQDLPLDSLLRAQAAHGLFASVGDVEVEIARRVAVLRSGDASGVPQPGPDNEALILHGVPIPEAGFMLLLSGMTWWQPAAAPEPAPAPSTDVEEPVVREAVMSDPIDW